MAAESSGIGRTLLRATLERFVAMGAFVGVEISIVAFSPAHFCPNARSGWNSVVDDIFYRDRAGHGRFSPIRAVAAPSAKPAARQPVQARGTHSAVLDHAIENVEMLMFLRRICRSLRHPHSWDAYATARQAVPRKCAEPRTHRHDRPRFIASISRGWLAAFRAGRGAGPVLSCAPMAHGF
jgi:hypothetical protein